MKKLENFLNEEFRKKGLIPSSDEKYEEKVSNTEDREVSEREINPNFLGTGVRPYQRKKSKGKDFLAQSLNRFKLKIKRNRVS